MFVLTFENPFDGITLYGPFDTLEEAIAYAEFNALDYEDWWVTKLHPPEPRVTFGRA